MRAQVRARLAPLPPVCAIVGPVGTGRVELVRDAMLAEGIHPAEVHVEDNPDTQRIRDSFEDWRRSPLGAGRGVVYVLDTVAPQGLNAMLAGIEDPPDATSFALVAKPGRLPLTLLSRCQVLRVGYLRPEELVDGLVARGLSRRDGEMRARRVRTVTEGLAGVHSQERGDVVRLVEACTRGEVESLAKELARVDDTHRHLLRTMAREFVTQRPRTFSEADLSAMTSGLAQAILRGSKGRSARVSITAMLLPVALHA